jgi:hypothetical protein
MRLLMLFSSVVVRIDARFALVGPVCQGCVCWGIATGGVTIVPRGGGADNDVAHHEQKQQATATPEELTSPRQSVAVGWVRQTSTIDNSSSSSSQQTAMFYAANREVYTSNLLDQDSIETLAITSDVMLITIDSSTVSGWESLTESIVKGATRRRDAGFPKLAVLVVWTTSASAASSGVKEGDSWKDRTVLEQIVAPFTPDIIASLDIVSETEAESTYQHVIADLPSEVTVADHEEYRLMIQQVYKSLTAKDCNVTFDIADAALFQSSQDKDTLETTTT